MVTAERLNSCSDQMNFKNRLSLKTLIVMGFAIAVIPLFISVMYAIYELRETAALGRTINSQIFKQTRMIRLVLDKTSDIERKARLFVLLSAPTLRQPYERESYEAARASFKQTLTDLLKMHVDNKIALSVNELTEKENLIYQHIIGSESEDSLQLPVDAAFQGLRESSYTLSREFESHAEHTFNELRQLSESLEQGLLVKGSLLLFLSCSFVILLLVVLSRSVEQLHSSIRRLGAGQLDKPIEVSGPADLHRLGQRLEWLRSHLLALETSKLNLMKNIAHEIEQSIQEIRDNTEGLTYTQNQSNQDPEGNVGQRLKRNVEKLKRVSEQLLHYSQIQSDQDLQAQQEIDMKALLDSVVIELEPSLHAKSLKLKKLIKPLHISGLAKELQEMIKRLLVNSIQYSPTAGEIRIMLRDDGDQVELEIEDDGPGIPPEERAQVFEPFYRGKSAANDEVGDHLGLGLTLAREYANKHRGTVEIIDARQDHPGTRILVRLPINLEN